MNLQDMMKAGHFNTADALLVFTEGRIRQAECLAWDAWYISGSEPGNRNSHFSGLAIDVANRKFWKGVAFDQNEGWRSAKALFSGEVGPGMIQ